MDRTDAGYDAALIPLNHHLTTHGDTMTARLGTTVHSRRIRVTLAAFTTVVISGIGGCAAHQATRSSALAKPTQTTSAAVPQTTGGSETTGAAAACGLVSAADVSSTIGEPMIQAGGEAADCTYTNADHSKQLLVHEFLDHTNMDNLIQQFESSSEHVTGLGDDAFWNGTIDMMFVRNGGQGFTITSPSLGAKTPTDRDAPKAAMIALATTALSNL
jgi:hypothetical protein